MDTYDTSPLTRTPQFRTSSSPPSTNTPSPTSDTTITTNDSFNNINPVERPNDSLRLKKNIGLVRGVSYVMGGIIGVGIFVSPQAVLLNTGGSVGISLCVWAFCAVVAFCGGLTYAELGSRIRKSGGSYTYVRAAWGDWAGFVFLWTQLTVVRPMATALGAMTAAEYALRPVFIDCPDMVPRSSKTLVALCILGILVFLNSYDTSWGGTIQTLSTVCKMSALVIIVVIGVIFFCTDGEATEHFEDMFSQQGMTVGGLTLAIYSCNYAYIGWDNLNMATEEVKKAQRNIPLSILLAVGLTSIVYISAIVSYHAVLTTPQIVSGLAVAAVFTEVTVPPLLWVIVPCIAISATGIVNVIIFTSTRINFIGGRDGLFPEVLSMVSVSRKSPLVSCLVLGMAAAIVVLLGDVITVLGTYALFRASGETAAILGIFRLRRKFPASENTYVVPTAAPVFYLLLHLSLVVVALTRDTERYVIPFLLTLSGVPLYFLSKSRVCREGPLKKLNDAIADMCRKLLLCEFASKTY
ncbi:Y+L amino acid transporter 2-like [Littorina saxatilis]|uniref:Uncharacterized protein n=1 Tax=Littorina saxatilis TaxID=31220 RepID=A0AAN9BQE1_9CAEN